MTLGTLISTIISIAFLYSVLALFTSELQEYLAAIFESRAKRLKQSIRQMLGEQDWPFYQLTSEKAILNGSKIWLKDGIVNHVTDNRTFTLINNSDNKEVKETDVIENPLNLDNFYVKGDAVTKYPIYLASEAIEANSKIYLKAGNVQRIINSSNLTSDQQFIWIKDSDNTEVKEADVTLDAGTDNKGTSKIDSLVVTKYSVYAVSDIINAEDKVWLKDGIVPITDDTNLTSDQQFIWINDSNNTEVKETEVIEDSNNLGKGNIKGSAVTKYPVHTISAPIEADSIYWLNVFSKKITDNKDKPIVELGEFKVDSLTEKLYQHRNIRALNQSGFAWFSLRKDPVSKICFVIGILALIASRVSLANNDSLLFLVCLGVFVATILGFTLYYVKGEDKSRKGKVRKSVGPSYIDADVFARTLIDVIKHNTTKGIHDKEDRLNTLAFYTPAKSILGEMLKKVESEPTNNNPSTQELITALTKKYETGFEEVQDRSSGVYKRNAKGLSFLIGFLIAILLNADTFNMVTQLMKTDNETANKIVTELDQKQKEDPQFFEPNCSPGDSDPKCMEKKFSQLADIYKDIDTLPLGWKTEQINPANPEIAKITKLTNTITMLSDLKAGNEEGKNTCDIQQLIENNKAVKNAETELNQAKPKDKAAKDQVLQTAKNNKMNAEKECFEGMEDLFGNTTNSEIVAELNQDESFKTFKNSIGNVRNQTGIIDESKLSQFQEEYIKFIDQKKKARLSSILNLKNEIKLYPTLTEHINTTVEKQGGWYKVPFGWLITAIALSMGAPFWFDLLSRIMNVRNAKKNDDAK